MGLKQITLAVLAATSLAVGYVLACGPEITNFITTNHIEPVNMESYSRGSLGVVRPPFARRHLVQAYRVFAGQLTPLPPPPPASPYRTEGVWRHMPGTFEDFLNCPAAADDFAEKTLNARVQRFGASSKEVSDWKIAQAVVFLNCNGDDVVLPPPAAQSDDPIVRADRDYQTAAAYFYATRYEEAERRFLAIAQDMASPWQPYGRYMAARALIRSATVIEANKARAPELLAAAEVDLRAIPQDPTAPQVHEWARQLLGFVALRIHPVERLHELSRVLATSSNVTRQDLDDYSFLMDSLVGPFTDYDYARVARRNEMRDGDDLSDWIIAIQAYQGEGDEARDRAVARWRETRKTHWLVAALWQLSGPDQAADSVLAAAGTVPRSSPAYATVGFLRVRLLARLGRRGEARAVLATLPTAPARDFEQEAVNFITAERLMLADSLDQFLANVARRTIVVETPDQRDPRPAPSGFTVNQPVMDDDAAIVLNRRFPLNRLVDAAASPILPRRLRVRVASAAFARAVLLDREDAGLRVAPVLAQLAPALKSNLDRYVGATTTDDRQIAGVFVLLKTPGMRPTVLGIDDNYSSRVADPATRFDGDLHRNGWCNLKADLSRPSRSALVELMYGRAYPEWLQNVPFPDFITADERAATERELQALVSISTSRTYLGTQALSWARTSPKDPRLADALERTVTGWHFTQCRDDEDQWDIARQAFVNLHRLFPRSDAAKQTPYWQK